MRPVESIPDLRRICQEPFRDQNDIPAVLYGARLSIHVTRLLLRLGLGASSASTAMVVAGLAGALLPALGGGWIALGLALLVVAYVLDCVDGEMARYQRIDSYRWAAVDRVHHLLTKGLSFLSVGVGLHRDHGEAWTIVAGAVGSISWLLLLAVRDLPQTLFAQKIVLDVERARNPAFLDLLDELDRRGRVAPRVKRDPYGADFELRPWVVRTFLTTFEIVVPMLLAATLADRALERDVPLASVVLGAYALVLPLQVVGSVRRVVRGDRVGRELRELTSRAEELGAGVRVE